MAKSFSKSRSMRLPTSMPDPRRLPVAPEAEEATLGAMLIGEGYYTNIGLSTVRRDDFYREGHRLIYDAIAGIVAAGESPDLVNVITSLRDAGKLEEVGGPAYLLVLRDSCPSCINIAQYAAKVVEASAKREAMILTDNATSLLANANGSAREIIAELTRKLEESTARLSSVAGGEIFEEGAIFMGRDFKVEWLVNDLIPAGAIILLAGKPKGGKSLLALEIGCAVLTGDTAMERFAARRGMVIIVQQEDPGAVLQARLKSIGFNEPAPFYVCTRRITLEALGALRAKIKETSALLCIIDPLIETLQVEDENDAAQMATAMRPLRDLARETGCALLLVHHTRKSVGEGGDEIRGSSALYGASDGRLTLRVQQVGGERFGTLDVELRAGVSHKHAMKLDHQTLRWLYLEDGEREIAQLTARSDVLRALGELVEASVTDISQRIGKPRRTVQHAINQLSSIIFSVRKDGKTPIYSLRKAKDEE